MVRLSLAPPKLGPECVLHNQYCISMALGIIIYLVDILWRCLYLYSKSTLVIVGWQTLQPDCPHIRLYSKRWAIGFIYSVLRNKLMSLGEPWVLILNCSSYKYRAFVFSPPRRLLWLGTCINPPFPEAILSVSLFFFFLIEKKGREES